MPSVVTSAPAKIILFGEHGVNRAQPALATAVDLRTVCRITPRSDSRYTLRSGDRVEEGDLAQVHAYRRLVDRLRAAQALDQIREQARDFFAPARYVLAHVLPQTGDRGLEIEWRSALPIGSGLGSGAAANTSLVLGVYAAAGQAPHPEAIVHAAWQGDVIAHGGVASSLDSSTSTYGGLLRYTAAAGAEVLPLQTHLAVVIGDTQVQHNTAALNTHVRRWLEEQPVRMQLFRDMGWLVRQAITALASGDTQALGHIGAKISGSGGGGIIIALVDSTHQPAVASAINAAGGCAYTVTTGAAGVRVEPSDAWERALH
jgi:mevalonate kinase